MFRIAYIFVVEKHYNASQPSNLCQLAYKQYIIHNGLL